MSSFQELLNNIDELNLITIIFDFVVEKNKRNNICICGAKSSCGEFCIVCNVYICENCIYTCVFCGDLLCENDIIYKIDENVCESCHNKHYSYERYDDY